MKIMLKYNCAIYCIRNKVVSTSDGSNNFADYRKQKERNKILNLQSLKNK